MNNYYQKILLPMARISLFIIYFWFGILKVLDLSPASNLVQDLFTKTIPFMSFHVFFILFGIFECLIGIFFLIKGLEKIVIPMFIIHIITTFGPLLFLPSET